MSRRCAFGSSCGWRTTSPPPPLLGSTTSRTTCSDCCWFATLRCSKRERPSSCLNIRLLEQTFFRRFGRFVVPRPLARGTRMRHYVAVGIGMPEPFGRFLVRQGRCSNQELLDALMEQGRLRPPALAIAVQLGFLSAAQALDVLGEMPDDRHPEPSPRAHRGGASSGRQGGTFAHAPRRSGAADEWPHHRGGVAG